MHSGVWRTLLKSYVLLLLKLISSYSIMNTIYDEVSGISKTILLTHHVLIVLLEFHSDEMSFKGLAITYTVCIQIP